MNILKFKHKKIFSFFILLFIFSKYLIPVNTAYAKITGHDTYMIQPRLNENGVYTAEVVVNENGLGKSLEQRNKINLGNYFHSNVYYNDGTNNVMNVTDAKVFDGFGKYLYFSFPSHDSESGTDNNYNNLPGDKDRASKVSELIFQLNDLIEYVDALDGNKDLENAEEVIEATAELSKGLSNPNKKSNGLSEEVKIGNVCKIYYGFYNDGSKEYYNGIHYDISSSKDIKLKAYVLGPDETFDINKVNSYKSFYWAQLKGYLAPSGKLFDGPEDGMPYLSQLSKTKISPMGSSLSASSGDNTWITIFDMAAIANYYKNIGTTTSDANEEANWIEKTIVEICSSLAIGVKNLLGLKDITQLIYTNNEDTLSGGTMNNSWWSVMLKYHLIFQIAAWLLVGLAVAKVLIELNFSTINPNTRVSIFDTLQKIFLVGFLLALAVPIIRLMTDVNSSIVGIFATQADATDGDMFAIGGTLASIFAYLSYLGILLMLNCTYIMRGIMIAIFGAAAPLFIVSMLFSKGKGMFDNWLKEMAANIFLQSIHAFAFTFLFSVIKTSTFLPKLVIFWSLMPITEQFRGFIFGGAGGFTTKQGMQMGSFLQKQVTASARTATSTAGKVGASAYTNMSKNGQKFDLKSANETGNASKSNAGGSGGSGGVGSRGGSGNVAANTAKTLSEQQRAHGGKGNLASAIGHGLSATGQIGGSTMSMMDAMTDMQMQNFEGASRGFAEARETAGNMVSSTGEILSQKAGQGMINHAKKKLEEHTKNNDEDSKNISNYANKLMNGDAESQTEAAKKMNFNMAQMKEGRKLKRYMERAGVSNLNHNSTSSGSSLSYGASSFTGKNGKEYSSVRNEDISASGASIASAYGASNEEKVIEFAKTYGEELGGGRWRNLDGSIVNANSRTIENYQDFSSAMVNNNKARVFNQTDNMQNLSRAVSSHSSNKKIYANASSGSSSSSSSEKTSQGTTSTEKTTS